MLVVGLLGTLAICYQNGSSALAFGWGLIHGAGPVAVLAFLPLAAGLGVLWGGYLFLRKKPLSRKPLVFAAYACAIVVLNELLLPGTPLNRSTLQRTLADLKIDKMRDEVALSGRGNPIGIRLTFDLVVPQTGSYAISPTAFEFQDQNTQYGFHLARGNRPIITPEPVNGEFRERVVYTFSKVFLPNFLGHDDRTAQPCFDTSVVGHLGESAFVSTLSRVGSKRFRTTIQVDRDGADRMVVAAEYVTGQSYDLGAFHKTIVIEGIQRCGAANRLIGVSGAGLRPDFQSALVPTLGVRWRF